MPLGIHPVFIVALLLIVLIIFGPGKLPELGSGIGRGLKEFRKSLSHDDDVTVKAEAASETEVAKKKE